MVKILRRSASVNKRAVDAESKNSQLRLLTCPWQQYCLHTADGRCGRKFDGASPTGLPAQAEGGAAEEAGAEKLARIEPQRITFSGHGSRFDVPQSLLM